jgi:hypothetical protein
MGASRGASSINLPVRRDWSMSSGPRGFAGSFSIQPIPEPNTINHLALGVPDRSRLLQAAAQL